MICQWKVKNEGYEVYNKDKIQQWYKKTEKIFVINLIFRPRLKYPSVTDEYERSVYNHENKITKRKDENLKPVRINDWINIFNE